jgi:hypothetical protein
MYSRYRVIERYEGARDDRDVHEVPEVPHVRAGMQYEAEVEHLKREGNMSDLYIYRER